jgi:hypothetical protein
MHSTGTGHVWAWISLVVFTDVVSSAVQYRNCHGDSHGVAIYHLTAPQCRHFPETVLPGLIAAVGLEIQRLWFQHAGDPVRRMEHVPREVKHDTSREVSRADLRLLQKRDLINPEGFFPLGTYGRSLYCLYPGVKCDCKDVRVWFCTCTW